MAISGLHVKPETPILDVVRVVATNDGKVLLVKEFDDENWKLPGGKTHAGETIFEAIVREIQEELGFTIKEEALVSYVKALIPHSENFRHIVLANINDDQIQTTTEVVERLWAPVNDIPPGKFHEHISSAVDFVTG